MDSFQLPSPIILGLASAAILVVVYIIPRIFGKRKYPLPPGPPGEFLLGHYRVVPFVAAFKKYAEWGKEYKSDVLYFETFGTKWVVLNSLQAAVDLLDKRGSNYSDRPRFILFEEMGWAPTLTWLRWGPQMQRHRKVLQPAFSKSQIRQYQDNQRRQALIFLNSVLDDPENWNSAVRRFAVAIVLNISFGIDVDGPNSPWIKIADDAAEAISNSGAPASSIVDRFPATRRLPTWLPFMERLRYARKWRWAIEAITNIPFAQAKKEVDEKINRKCFAHDRLNIYNGNIEKGQNNEFTMDDIRGAAAAIYIAGNDTTATTVVLFALYLMQNPDLLAKAQEEIDRVVGNGRLPTWDDIPNLPYLNLILQETYRMNPLSPLGIPHAAVNDDVYNGMFIPKGTIVYQNVWAMHHNDAVYADPFSFRPERYLPKEEGGNAEPFPVGNFGFGRRICIGRNLAENSLTIVLANMIATMDIQYPLDAEGKRTPFEPEWSYRGQAHPLPFPVSFSPRSPKAEELLRASARAAS
ncbi:Cytochrome p450 2c31 [Pleurostoma richardsiae]|uniref:Cytochrome p450 2c31 n=1 Tax=Pleurostoma richardsiae TaxID=41990 RepID=A0AA38RQL0_9PEZI|nr:Cytochrome p450 2c31 [Pleurostoma richardsiae]